jgi:hypothetical protein
VAVQAALGAGAVVAHDVEDDGVFVVAFGFDVVQQPADFMIGVRQKAAYTSI